jgi:hypothetical protein
MFELSFTRDRWLILAYGIGLVLVLLFFLGYFAAKRPRRPELYQSAEAPRPFSWSQTWNYIPWILILTYLGTFVYSVVDIILKMRYPPNY